MAAQSAGNKGELSLHEIRDFVRRKRMGIGEPKSREQRRGQRFHEQAIGYIQESFSIKECMRYVADETAAANYKITEEVCYCGQKRSHHSMQSTDQESDPWVEADISTFPGSNAFGSILFRDEHSGARKPSKFLRIGSRVQMPGFLEDVQNGDDVLSKVDPETWQTIDNVLTFMKDDWQLFSPAPSLAVAIIGGAKQFKLDSKRVETFTRGLIKVANSTNAWILTGGCNYGIMKIVGDAVREGQNMDSDDEENDGSAGNDSDSRTRCIGIALWGYVKDRDSLIIRSRGSNRRPQTAYGTRSSSVPISTGPPQLPSELIPRNNLFRAYKEPVRMYTAYKSGKSEAYLNPDHTHFVFVDNGLRNHKCIHNSSFMMCLLRRLNSGESPIANVIGGLIPSVVIVVEGGYSVIDAVFFCVHVNIPVVICTHTGRAADIFATAAEILLDVRAALPNPDTDAMPMPMPGDHNFSIIHTKIGKAFFKDSEYEVLKETIDKMTSRVFQTVSKLHLVTLFDLTAREDFDSAILSALLKVNRHDGASNNKNEESALDQLNLALTWDRSDIAEEKIFPFYPDDERGRDNLKAVMKTALMKGKQGFVTLLINKGFSIREFLNVDVLASLYKTTIEKNKFLSKLFNEFKRSHLATIRRINEKHKESGISEMYIYWHFVSDFMPFYESPSFDETKILSNPYRELFFWAVLSNRVEMATYFWQKLDHSIVTALLAALLSKACADRAPVEDSDVSDSYIEAKNHYERLSTNLINRCALSDRHMSVIVLERNHSNWGNSNCLKIASFADCKKFVGSPVCQDVLNHRWQKNIVSPWPFVCLGIILSPLVPLLIQFDFGHSTTFAIGRKLSRLFDLYKHSSKVDNISVAASKAKEQKYANNDAMSLQLHLKKYHRFFTAPVTKFYFSTMMNCLFLALFTYVLLFAYHNPTHGYERRLEYILHCWVFTYLCESVFEMLRYQIQPFRRKFSFWWKSIWNKAQSFAIILYTIGFILRMIAKPEDTYTNFVAKVFFAFAIFVFYVQLLRALNASTTLGPQLVMIGNMLIEMVPFLVLIYLCIMGFGVLHAATFYDSGADFTFKEIKFLLDYGFWPLVSGPDLTEIQNADKTEASRSTAVRQQCNADNSTQCDTEVGGDAVSVANFSVTTSVNVSSSVMQTLMNTSVMVTTVADGLFSNSSQLENGNATALTALTNLSISTSPGDDNPNKVAAFWFLSALLAFWVLFAVLLVNLLIAIFSNVYDEVNKNSNEIWKYYQLQLITEFENKLALPPPFSIIGVTWKVSKVIYYRLKHCRWRPKLKRQNSLPFDDRGSFSSGTMLVDPSEPDDKPRLHRAHAVEDADHDPALHFEHENQAAFMRDKKRQEKHGGVVNQLADIHKQLDTIRGQVSRLGRLETIAEAAVVEADKADKQTESADASQNTPRDERDERDDTPVFSVKKARSRGSPAFTTQSQPLYQTSSLEKRVENLTLRVAKVQELSTMLLSAVSSKQAEMQKQEHLLQQQRQQQQQQQQQYELEQQQKHQLQQQYELKQQLYGVASAEPDGHGVKTTFTSGLVPTSPLNEIQRPIIHSLNQYETRNSLSSSLSAAVEHRQIVLPVAGVGLASVPRPVIQTPYVQQRTFSSGQQDRERFQPGSARSNNQLILDWPMYSNSRTPRSPLYDNQDNFGNNN